jgi:hypothetical protein
MKKKSKLKKNLNKIKKRVKKTHQQNMIQLNKKTLMQLKIKNSKPL